VCRPISSMPVPRHLLSLVLERRLCSLVCGATTGDPSLLVQETIDQSELVFRFSTRSSSSSSIHAINFTTELHRREVLPFSLSQGGVGRVRCGGMNGRLLRHRVVHLRMWMGCAAVPKAVEATR
jgi:hypothetical protein